MIRIDEPDLGLAEVPERFFSANLSLPKSQIKKIKLKKSKFKKNKFPENSFDTFINTALTISIWIGIIMVLIQFFVLTSLF